jgi:hypothetical protein
MPFFYILKDVPDGQKVMINLIPKNGCTTLANMVLQIDGINPPKKEQQPDTWYKFTHINVNSVADYTSGYYPIEADISIAVKRDPVKRFLSFYRNRILFHKDLSDTPSIDTLQANFDHYIASHVKIQEHGLSQTHYAGRLENYTHIYNMNEFDKIAAMLSSMFKKTIIANHLQQGGNNIDIELTKKQISWIHNYYQEDYQNGWHE